MSVRAAHVSSGGVPSDAVGENRQERRPAGGRADTLFVAWPGRGSKEKLIKSVSYVLDSCPLANGGRRQRPGVPRQLAKGGGGAVDHGRRLEQERVVQRHDILPRAGGLGQPAGGPIAGGGTAGVQGAEAGVEGHTLGPDGGGEAVARQAEGSRVEPQPELVPARLR